MDVIKLLQEQAQKSKNQPAIIFRQQPVNFLQLKAAVFKLANSLQSLGLKKGDKAAVYLPNCPEYVYSYLAIWCCGATAVPLDFMLTGDELNSCIAHSQAKFLIAKEKANFSLASLKENCWDLKEIIYLEEKTPGFLTIAQLLAKGLDKAPVTQAQDKDYAIIFYTSGTTGKPKGVLINYLQLSAPPKSMDFFVGGFKDDDVSLCALPFSHLGGLIYIQNCLSFGLTMVLMERFAPLDFLREIQSHKVTCFWIVPSMYYAFLQLKEFETFDLSSIRWMVTFGASNSPDALRRFHQFCPQAHLLNGWGMTETNAPTVVLPRGSEKIESVGQPLPWVEVKIFSDGDQELVAGSVGEIVVRSWVVTDGYYKDPQLTSETLRNGWFHTGDLGKFDPEGNLYIVGRIKEMIKVGGEIVFEPEVEAALQKHSAVAEAAVVGIADKLRGEVPKAFIALKPGQQLSEEDLRSFLRQHLAHFKIPHQFEFLAALPKNRVGKIDKESLRK